MSNKNKLSTPEEKIFEEMDMVAECIDQALRSPENEGRSSFEIIQAELDAWVKKRVVRFYASHSCAPGLEESTNHERYLQKKIMRQMEEEIARLCGVTQKGTDEYSLALYIFAFQECF